MSQAWLKVAGGAPTEAIARKPRRATRGRAGAPRYTLSSPGTCPRKCKLGTRVQCVKIFTEDIYFIGKLDLFIGKLDLAFQQHIDKIQIETVEFLKK